MCAYQKMNSNRGASKAGKSTINYHRLPSDEQQLSEPVFFLAKDRGANQQLNQSTQLGGRYTDRRLSTPQLVSALTGIWNLVGQPESSGTTQTVSHGILHGEDPVCFSKDEKGHTLTTCCPESSTGIFSQTCLSTPKSVYEDLSSVKKMLMLTSCSSVVGASSTWRHVHVTNKFGRMHYLQYRNVYPMQTEKMGTYAASSSMGIKDDQILGRHDNYSSETRNMTPDLRTSSIEEANITHASESSLNGTRSNVDVFSAWCNSSACSFEQMVVGKESRIMPVNQISSTCEHVQFENSTCTSCLVGDDVVNSPNADQYTYGEDMSQFENATCISCLVGDDVVNSPNADQYTYGEDMSQQHFVDKCPQEFESSFQRRLHGAVTVNRHAAAGALAGTVVSVSLHPVDTVKTIIQANSSGESSFYHTLRRALVERGVLGLYGGLASKIVCSAPISAIYTLTYEIVKGALLPILPKDCHSIAHCAAGGCSSIATSFVFTPSECIKQQMQVGSQYQNCWNALLGCLQRGGIASLYAGWGAVLCRNVPHSIVKFYAYESLKQFLLDESPANAKLDSGQTLFCGGFAGSTAALFTTPFDVVKTRVQLQALNPARKYEGVLHALAEIFQQEGLRGLYRGLTPRLVMYVSQGAIFFTSYEFLKTIMFPEQELPGRSF